MSVEKARLSGAVGRCPVTLSLLVIYSGNLADLIFVFFDPIGQALCKRTLNIVGKFVTIPLELVFETVTQIIILL